MVALLSFLGQPNMTDIDLKLKWVTDVAPCLNPQDPMYQVSHEGVHDS